jgi:VIT1/CCC1 family predicted Fe2+/Mn2+ transporter
MVLTAAALFITGAVLSLFTGRSALLSGFRMFFIGACATTLTYFIGSWIGVSIP